MPIIRLNKVTRFFDFILSLIGLVVLAPIFFILAIWIKTDSSGPVFYKQIRVGKNGKDFSLFKFRSMVVDAEKKGLITVGGRDPRITRSGYFIRKYKLDELPQLMNVLVGDMSLVGPRPEVRKYVDLYNEEQQKILSVQPGITDYASIEYMDENEILGKSDDPEKTYIEEIMSEKIKYNMKYIQNKSLIEYFKIIFLTVLKIIR
ncbi:sugar transferase [Rodentibacter pneumotropicus]|uniref:Sugar transferase n=1 Tax=Rodentibacter pneumotropicus TaxID=758 RepID=A0AAW5LC82_9PAST|nr:sugar transferase [Rodentibacter pneumotropicus]MCQ9121678.1 sugar transferase [Rodentibacter pneumotropicus]